MKVLVCGGRTYSDVAKLWHRLDELDKESEGGIRCVIDGASDDVTGPYIGADYWGHQWALARNKPTVRVHAEWIKLGKAAGPIRNKRMRDEHMPDVVVAAPGAKGTANMIKLAEESGIRVVRITR